MDEQQIHDEAIANRKPMTKEMAAELKQHLGSAPGAEISSQSRQFTAFDPIANAMERHPGLTREEAERMAEAFGF